jgi:hypothetical protein
VPLIVPWNAWACAFSGKTAAVASAMLAQEMSSLFRVARQGR